MSLHDLQLQNPELYEQLVQIADRRTIPFCYLCYKDAHSGRCAHCGTDDLMRHLPGAGVEYGYEWVIEHLLEQEVDDISEDEQEEIYMEFIDSCYGDEVQIGFLNVNTSRAIKELDPVAFNLAMSEYFMDEAYIEIAGKLFYFNNIETWVEDQLTLFEDEKNQEEVLA